MNFQVIIDELLQTTLYLNILESLKNVLIGFIIAFIVSIILCFLLYEFKTLNKIVYPIIELLRPIPNAGWVPIAIIVCKTNYLNISKLYKLNRKDKYLKIVLPSILPSIFTSLMLGISGGWLSVIMAEMISGKVGLGYYTWKNYTLLCYEKVFLGIIFMGILGASFSLVISLISKKTLFWVKGGE